MFYHDHSDGITRLNVYAGEAAPYVLRDPVEQELVDGSTIGTTQVAKGTIPATEIPLVIQDKTFVPNGGQLARRRPDLGHHHVGRLRQQCGCRTSTCPTRTPPTPAASTRWAAGTTTRGSIRRMVPQTYGPVANPLAGTTAREGPDNPGTPTRRSSPRPSWTRPLVNGVAYPYLKVGRHAYRFRILNASDDRTLNLQLYYAKTNAPMWNANGTLNSANAGEVPMVAAAAARACPTQLAHRRPRRRRARAPRPPGPSMVQIGNEGGLPAQPRRAEEHARSATSTSDARSPCSTSRSHTLMLGPAERADVIVDFSKVPAGAKLILYNDAPHPIPGFDTRLDYYTGDPDQTAMRRRADDHRRLRPRHPHHHAVPGHPARRAGLQRHSAADRPARRLRRLAAQARRARGRLRQGLRRQLPNHVHARRSTRR